MITRRRNRQLDTPRKNIPNVLTKGNSDAPILVVCDAPTASAYKNGEVMSSGYMELFLDSAEQCGLYEDDFYFITPCPPLPESFKKSDAKKRDYLKEHQDEFWLKADQAREQQLTLCLGALASRQCHGRAVKITKSRGMVEKNQKDQNVLTMYSPSHIKARPEEKDIFMADMATLGRLYDAGFDPEQACVSKVPTNYYWSCDVSAITAEYGYKPIYAFDIEGLGVDVMQPNYRALCAQITPKEGVSILVPTDREYYREALALHLIRQSQLCEKMQAGEPLTPAEESVVATDFPTFTDEDFDRAEMQLADFLEDERIKKVGHNLKFDLHAMYSWGRIKIKGWVHDTIQMAFAADENMKLKSLAECVRRWVPSMAGYSDSFDQIQDKSRMDTAPLWEMTQYGGGDTDATKRLAKVLMTLLMEDKRNLNCYTRIQMPCLNMMVRMERNGVEVDDQALREFHAVLIIREDEEYKALMAMIPAKIRREFLRNAPKKAPKEALSFSRGDFLRAILFRSKRDGGRGLTPKVFTPSTRDAEKREDMIPSTSVGDHLPYFEDDEFVQRYMEYSKLKKMLSTYVGDEAEGKGFWQHIKDDRCIHPSFNLHGTVTGRSSSRNPNGQNIPKRHALAKPFRQVLRAKRGKVFIAADLSQAELRIAACMANERNMIQLYADGVDLHTATAAMAMGISMEEFNELPKAERKIHRQGAKAINFGFIYGMWWKSFKVYAKTQYGVEYSDAEAKRLRDTYFKAYPDLVTWHERAKKFVRKNKHVRALHGSLRRLASIDSELDGIVNKTERDSINSPVQRFGSDLGLIAMIRFFRDCPEGAEPALFIHDDNTIEVDEDKAYEYAGYLKYYMENPPLLEWFGITLPVPVVSDIEIGVSLGEMEEIEDIAAVKPDWYVEG